MSAAVATKTYADIYGELQPVLYSVASTLAISKFCTPTFKPILTEKNPSYGSLVNKIALDILAKDIFSRKIDILNKAYTIIRDLLKDPSGTDKDKTNCEKAVDRIIMLANHEIKIPQDLVIHLRSSSPGFEEPQIISFPLLLNESTKKATRAKSEMENLLLNDKRRARFRKCFNEAVQHQTVEIKAKLDAEVSRLSNLEEEIEL